MSRLHAPRRELLVKEMEPFDGRRAWLLLSPAPGWFRPSVGEATWCAPGTVIGTLDVLGRVHELVVPAGVSGNVPRVPTSPELTSVLVPRAVVYGELVSALLPLSVFEDQAAAGDTAEPASAARDADGLVFRAPTSGRFYGRSSPDKPPFVAAGSTLAHGATICLLEVMKTFHRVTYGGAGLPETARIVRVLVADGDDVNAGDPLLALE